MTSNRGARNRADLDRFDRATLLLLRHEPRAALDSLGDDNWPPAHFLRAVAWRCLGDMSAMESALGAGGIGNAMEPGRLPLGTFQGRVALLRGERTRAQVMAQFQSECVSLGGRAKLSLDLRILERMLEGCPVPTR